MTDLATVRALIDPLLPGTLGVRLTARPSG